MLKLHLGVSQIGLQFQQSHNFHIYKPTECHNFNGIQFQHAREARQRKNSIQFQRCNKFYFLKIIFRYNFSVLRISTFYISKMMKISTKCKISTFARPDIRARGSRQRKDSIQFQRCNNFYFFGNDISLQFLRAQNFYFSYFTN